MKIIGVLIFLAAIALACVNLALAQWGSAGICLVCAGGAAWGASR